VLLGAEAPWKVMAVELDLECQRIEVEVGCVPRCPWLPQLCQRPPRKNAINPVPRPLASILLYDAMSSAEIRRAKSEHRKAKQLQEKVREMRKMFLGAPAASSIHTTKTEGRPAGT
jgi:hypothetical protein